jgi:hypothetical protein
MNISREYFYRSAKMINDVKRMCYNKCTRR